MAFLIREIIWFLLLTAVLWGAIGWWLRSVGHRSEARAMEHEYEAKIQRLIRSRDDFRDQLEQVAATTGSGKLSASQRSQIAAHIGKLEREAGEGREQVAALTAKLEAVGNTARERDAEYRRLTERVDRLTGELAQRDRELEQSKRELEQLRETVQQNEARPDTPAPEATAAQLRDYKHSIARLNARIESLSRQQQEPMATLEHSRLVDVIQAQKKTIAGLMTRLKARDEAHGDRPGTDDAVRDIERLRAEREDQARANREASVQVEQLRREVRELRERGRDQAETIVTLKEQLRKSVTPAPARGSQAANAGSEPPSDDLFATPPSVLLPSPEGQPDDLQKIHGVGPVLEARLNELGIFHYRQIAALSEDDIGWIASKMNAFPNRILRDRWVSQAATLAGKGPESPASG